MALPVDYLMQKMPVAVIVERRGGRCGGHPQRRMPRFGGRTEGPRRAGEVDGTKLFRPQVIVGHEGEAAIDAKAAERPDKPAGFFIHFPVQRLQG